jgi:endonuclease/exonuclease/phosphatase family metal-dependent hydrolase
MQDDRNEANWNPDEIKKSEISELMTYLELLKDLPTIITGDFNTKYPYKLGLHERFKTVYYEGPSTIYEDSPIERGEARRDKSTRGQIDKILISNADSVGNAVVIAGSEPYPSDHGMVIGTVLLT